MKINASEVAIRVTRYASVCPVAWDQGVEIVADLIGRGPLYTYINEGLSPPHVFMLISISNTEIIIHRIKNSVTYLRYNNFT